MTHQWEERQERWNGFSRKRQCCRCGLVQTYNSGRRSHTYSVSPSWFPPIGRCGRVNLRIKREYAGHYATADGRFRIWQSEGAGSFDGPNENRWYVNSTSDQYDETLHSSGFPTKWMAVRWLREHATDYIE